MRPFPFPLWLAMLICMAACQSESGIEHSNRMTTFQGTAMTMRYKVIVGSPLDRNQASQVNSLIADSFKKVDETYNKWNPNSELSKLNALKSGEAVPISKELEQLLKETYHVVKLSHLRFDPTIEPLQRLWKHHLEKGEVPADQEIRDIAPAIGWDKVHIDNGTFYKDDDRTEIDLGGIAKGLCIDLIVQNILNIGYKDLFVEWGGEIRAAGKHPDDRPWTVYISQLGDNDPEQAIDIVPLYDQAIATSGDYLQNWSVWESKGKSGVTYFHIFDPTTLKPLQTTPRSIASVSVLAPNCTLADGLATAGMLFPTVEEAEAWAEEIKKTYPELSFWFVTRQQDRQQDK